MRILGAVVLWSLGIIFLSTIQCSNIHLERELSRSRRVINGNNAPQGDYPWAVSLMSKKYSGIKGMFFNKIVYCGGVLISPKWVLTAAHCLYDWQGDKMEDLSDVKRWHIRMAQTSLTPSFVERIKGLFNRILNTLEGHDRHLQSYYHVDKIIVYPKYKPGTLEYDIAMFRIKEDPHVTKIRHASTIDLPQSNWPSWPKSGEMCTTVGWGCGRVGGPLLDRAQAIDLPIMEPKECLTTYKAYINLTTTHEFCAGYYYKSVGVCPGDSGGPLTCQHNGKPVLAGVVSATHREKPGNYPAIFTRVSYFVDWIKKTMAANNKEKNNAFATWINKFTNSLY